MRRKSGIILCAALSWVLWTQSTNVIYPLDEKWEIILGFEKKGECDRLRTNKFQESIAIHKKMGLGPSVEKLGGKVIDGWLQPRKDETLCPFKNDYHLCSLHHTPFKPMGCIISPFMLNKNDTLVVRNWYKFLKCYDKKDGQPAYKTFKTSLITLFGAELTTLLTKHLNKRGGNMTLEMTEEVYRILKQREVSLRSVK